MDDNVILTQPLSLLDADTQLYYTTPFDPPTTMYRIAVSNLIKPLLNFYMFAFYLISSS